MLDKLNPDQIEHLCRTYGKLIAGRALTEKEKQDYDNALFYAVDHQAYLTKKETLRLIGIQRETAQISAIEARSEAQKKLEDERMEYFQKYEQARAARAISNDSPPINIIDFDQNQFEKLFPKIALSFSVEQQDQLQQYERTKDINIFTKLVDSCSEFQLDVMNEYCAAKQHNKFMSQLPEIDKIGDLVCHKSKLHSHTPAPVGHVLEMLGKKSPPEQEADKKEDSTLMDESKVLAFKETHLKQIDLIRALRLLWDICEMNNLSYPTAQQAILFTKWYNQADGCVSELDKNIFKEERQIIQNKSFSLYSFKRLENDFQISFPIKLR